MKRILILLGMALLAVGGRAQEADMPKNQKAVTAEITYTRKVKMDYLLFTPKGYDADKNKKWPLMIFLHGAGERGTNVAKVSAHGPPKIVKERDDLPFVVVSPQCPSGEVWQPEAIIGLMDEALKKYRVDSARVYLTGLSMGGFGSWALAAKYPERFAAVAPICGGGDIINVLLAQRSKEAALKSLPIWAFHGAKDPVVKLEESERMVEAFKRAGNQTVKLTVYPEAQHDSWTESYKNEELYNWFLQHSRPQKAKN
jgi:predicted peptidase